MRPTHFRTLSIAAVALFLFAGSATAQTKSNPILNSVEVQQLVKRAEPGDNARLAAHFAALADQYTTQAKRHTAMAQSFRRQPKPQSGDGHERRPLQAPRGAQHTVGDSSCVSLERTTRSWRLAPQSTPPAGGTRFEGGAGAPAPTDKDLQRDGGQGEHARRSSGARGVLPHSGQALHRRRQRARDDGGCLPGNANRLGGRRIAIARHIVAGRGQGSQRGGRDAQAACGRCPVSSTVRSGPGNVPGLDGVAKRAVGTGRRHEKGWSGMRTIHLRALSVAALACLTFAAGVNAQTTSSAVLNSLEVQELIKRAQPADHARLEVHFAVLAEQYAGRGQTPQRNGAGVHCKSDPANRSQFGSGSLQASRAIEPAIRHNATPARGLSRRAGSRQSVHETARRGTL